MLNAQLILKQDYLKSKEEDGNKLFLPRPSSSIFSPLRFINISISSCKHLLNLFNNMFDHFAILENETLELHLSKFFITETISEVIEMYEVKAEEKEVGLSFKCH